MVAVPLLGEGVTAGWQQLPAEEGVLGDWRLVVVVVVSGVMVVMVVVAVEVVAAGEEGWLLAEQGRLEAGPRQL